MTEQRNPKGGNSDQIFKKKISSKTKLVQKIYCFDLQQGGDNKKTEIGGATFAESFRILPLIF